MCPEASRADWSSLEKLPDFPGGSTEKSPPAIQETLEVLARSLGRVDPLEEGVTAHSRILPGESHGRRSLVGFSPWGCTVRHD